MIDIAGIDYENMSSMPGLCVAIFTQGCDMNPHCKGCHNQDSWPIGTGVKYTTSELLDKIKTDKLSHQVAWIGGEPLIQWQEISEIVRILKSMNYTQMLFTGRTIKQVKAKLTEDHKFKDFIKYFDYIKAGPFVERLKSYDIRFRGSSNQRIYKPIISDTNIEFLDISEDWDNGNFYRTLGD